MLENSFKLNFWWPNQTADNIGGKYKLFVENMKSMPASRHDEM